MNNFTIITIEITINRRITEIDILDVPKIPIFVIKKFFIWLLGDIEKPKKV